MKRLFLAALVIAVCSRAYAEPPPDPRWMARCAHNLGSRHLPDLAVQTYCGCMAGLSDDEMLQYSQKKLETSFPWMHERCVARAADKMSTKQ